MPYPCTIVIPCYNEAERLDLRAFIEFTAQHEHELLFVNDGSSDHTADVLNDIAAADPNKLRVLHLGKNVGKAEAVRLGVLQALERNPQFVGYWDADLATPLNLIDDFFHYLKRHTHVDVLLGARVLMMGRRICRTPFRHYLGRIFATAASNVLKLPVYDTQCGAKLLRVTQRTQAAFRDPFLTKWLFDVELLARYLTLDVDATSSTQRVTAIHELPLTEWHDIDGSKVKPTDFLRAIGQLLAIHRTYRGRLIASSAACAIPPQTNTTFGSARSAEETRLPLAPAPTNTTSPAPAHVTAQVTAQVTAGA